MVSRSSGPWVTTFSILFLFIQGIYGEGLLVDVLDEESSEESKPLSSKDRYSLLTEALWNERVKKPWFRTTIKNPPFLESDIHHDDLSMVNIPGDPTYGDTWWSRIKKVLINIIAQKLPKIDEKINALLKLFWPNEKETIWNLIKATAEGLLDKNTINFVLDARNSDILNLLSIFTDYLKAEKEKKAIFMTTLLEICDDMFSQISKDEYAPHTIPIIITHSFPHLLLLRARLLYGKKIYDEDHTEVWRRELEDKIALYKHVLRKMFLKWVHWRKSGITVDVGAFTRPINVPPFSTLETYGTVHDEITGDSSKYTYIGLLGPNDEKFFKPLCKAVKKNILGFRVAEVLRIMLPSFFLDNFIPGNEDNPSVVPPSLSLIRFGPISPHIGGGNQSCHLHKPDDDNTRGGDVTKIIVREGNIIDGIQLFYSTHNGSFIGNSGGGKLHEFPLNKRRVKSIQLCKNECNMVEMTIGFSNGESSGRLGNRGRAKVQCVNVGDIATYGLYNIRATGVGCAQGLFQIGLDFKAYPVRPSEFFNQASYSMDLAQERFQDEKKRKCRSRRLKKRKSKGKKY